MAFGPSQLKAAVCIPECGGKDAIKSQGGPSSRLRGAAGCWIVHSTLTTWIPAVTSSLYEHGTQRYQIPAAKSALWVI